MSQGDQSRILVTGATGFIGGHLIPRLAARDEQLRLLVRNGVPANRAEMIESQGIEIARGDLLDATSLAQACNDIDTVIHLAGFAHANVDDAQASLETNVKGSENLANACARQGVKRLLFMSSVLAQDFTDGYDHSVYAESKLLAEQRLTELLRETDTELIILRPVNIYGEGMHGNLARLMRMIKDNRIPPLPALESSMQLLSVDNLCRVIEQCLETESWHGQTLTLCENPAISIKELEFKIHRAAGRNPPAWATPRVVLYAALMAVALLAKILGFLGAKQLASRLDGKRFWEKITTNRQYNNQSTDIACDLESELDAKLPDILASL